MAYFQEYRMALPALLANHAGRSPNDQSIIELFQNAYRTRINLAAEDGDIRARNADLSRNGRLAVIVINAETGSAAGAYVLAYSAKDIKENGLTDDLPRLGALIVEQFIVDTFASLGSRPAQARLYDLKP